MIWTEQREIELRQLREQGMSFTQISQEMGITRSAVAGKCKRLGLCVVRLSRKGTGKRPAYSRPILNIEPIPFIEPPISLNAGLVLTPRQRSLYDDLRKAVENTR